MGFLDLLRLGQPDQEDGLPPVTILDDGTVVEAPSAAHQHRRPTALGKLVGGLPGMIQGGIAGAATPNIAYGGPTDIFRAMQSGGQDSQQRDLLAYNRKRQQAVDQSSMADQASQAKLRSAQADYYSTKPQTAADALGLKKQIAENNRDIALRKLAANKDDKAALHDYQEAELDLKALQAGFERSPSVPQTTPETSGALSQNASPVSATPTQAGPQGSGPQGPAPVATPQQAAPQMQPAPPQAVPTQAPEPAPQGVPTQAAPAVPPPAPPMARTPFQPTPEKKAKDAAALAKTQAETDLATARTKNVGNPVNEYQGLLKQYTSPDGKVDYASANKAFEQIGIRRATAGKAVTAISLTPAAIDQAAKKYLQTGDLPSFGMGNQGATMRVVVANRAGELDPSANLAANKGTFGADTGSLKKIQAQRDSVIAFENTAEKNLDLFLQKAKSVVDTGSPWINYPLRAVDKTLLGSNDVAAYDAARQVALTEIAKVVNTPGMTGQLSDSGRKEVAELNPESATLGQIINVANVLKQDMANRHEFLDKQIAEIKGRLGAQPAAGAPAPQAGGMVNVQIPGQAPGRIPASSLDAFKKVHPDATVSQ